MLSRFRAALTAFVMLSGLLGVALPAQALTTTSVPGGGGKVMIDAHGLCRMVGSNIGDLMVPLKTADEYWRSDQSFLAKLTPGVSAIPCSYPVFLKALAPGNAHTCGLTWTNSVICWGQNNEGQLGNGTTVDSLTPVQVVGLVGNVTKIATTFNTTCALRTDRRVLCWGPSMWGGLGNGVGTNSSATSPIFSTPQLVVGITDAVAISANCAVLSAGSVKCWGRNTYGKVGSDPAVTGAAVNTPLTVAGTGVVADVSSGTNHVCVLQTNGNVRCWGDNSRGQVGNGSTVNTWVPQYLFGGATKINLFNHTSCAVRSGSAWCWGWDGQGQVGDGGAIVSTDFEWAPRQVLGLTSGVVDIQTGTRHSCAVKSDNSIYCWGAGVAGQLGDAGSSDQSSPVLASEFGTETSGLALGNTVTCVTMQAPGIGLTCTGTNDGQLGEAVAVGTSARRPVEVVFSTKLY
ncbi:RCC1 domain-containing protein [Defluviimonas salinarum]|uniref:Alpha-tubulin suppressor n=1 Tax=Defluviimonas salinarum TaxID=2992147 RepID=A0ABT3J508_9RHOB|nr:hypothetical protein [Defluviimonas salinarum]MCW3782545.1 hypothetical protein [Defluviimonas salinarum]